MHHVGDLLELGTDNMSHMFGPHLFEALNPIRLTYTNPYVLARGAKCLWHCRDEVYPWSSLSWAFSPSWIRVICQLCPSPPPHFATPLLPHTLQTSLGIHAKDTRTYTFDQVGHEFMHLQDICESW